MSIFLNRKSVRVYDENFKIPQDELNEILNITLRAPSSGNLQPTKFIVVKSSEAKDKIRPHMYGNLAQLNSSSAFIILTTDLNKYESGIKLFNKAEELGLVPSAVAERQRKSFKERNESFDLTTVTNTNYLDAGLIAMQLMLVAKDFGYDTCAIGGFNKETILKALNIEEPNTKPVLIVSIGKAKAPGFETYRRPLEDSVKYF